MSDFETNVGRIIRYMIEINGITDINEALKVLDEVKRRFKLNGGINENIKK